MKRGEEAETIKETVITQFLSMSELQDMWKGFSYHQASALSLGCYDAGIMGPEAWH